MSTTTRKLLMIGLALWAVMSMSRLKSFTPSAR